MSKDEEMIIMHTARGLPFHTALRYWIWGSGDLDMDALRSQSPPPAVDGRGKTSPLTLHFHSNKYQRTQEKFIQLCMRSRSNSVPTKDDIVCSCVSKTCTTGHSVSQVRAGGAVRRARGLRGPACRARGHCTELCREAVGCRRRKRLTTCSRYSVLI